jgi:hypothetical protein
MNYRDVEAGRQPPDPLTDARRPHPGGAAGPASARCSGYARSSGQRRGYAASAKMHVSTRETPKDASIARPLIRPHRSRAPQSGAGPHELATRASETANRSSGSV